MDERNLNRDAGPLGGSARDESLGGGADRPGSTGLGGTGTERTSVQGGTPAAGSTAFPATGGTGTDRTGGFAGTAASSAGGSPGTANTPSFSGGPADIGVSSSPPSSGGGTATQQDAKQMVKERAAQVGSQLEDRANTVMDRAAGGLQTAADRLDSLADQQGGGTGMRARAGEMAHSAADTLESAAGYLRENDARRLQEDLSRMVRERPLQTLLVAVAAGWVVGKVLR